MCAEPHRDRPLDRQRRESRPGYLLVAARVRDRALGPQPAQQGDLLGHPGAAVGEALAERLVLDGVPAEADSQPKPAAGQQVHFRRLLGDERGLPLRQDDDAGHQLQGGQRGQVAEEHQRLVKSRADVMRAVPALVHRGVGAQYVVVGQQVGETEFLHPRGVGADGTGTDLGLRKHDANVHEDLSTSSRSAPVPQGEPVPGCRSRVARKHAVRDNASETNGGHMEYRLLGRSGCAVSAFALGTLTFGNETDEAGSFAQLDRFTEVGGTLIDTADVYADHRSEEIIGRWLAQRPDASKTVVLATKGRFPTDDDPNGHGLSRRHLGAALDASLRRLGVATIDLYQVHAWDPLTPLEETLRFLDDATQAGKIHYIGLSNFTGWQLQKAVDVADARGLARPVTLQPQYNLLARAVEWEIVPACQSEGLGLLPWSPLASGWLTGKYRRDESPAGGTRVAENADQGMKIWNQRGHLDRTWQVLEAVRKVADGHGVSMAQVSIAWLAARPAVASVILGARNMEQLADNLAAADVRLSPEETQLLDVTSDPRPPDYPYGEPGQTQRSRRIEGGRF